MKADILIIGFGPGGIVSAMISKKYYPNKNIVLVTKKKTHVVPCAIPYMATSLEPEQNILSVDVLKSKNIEVIFDEIKNIDTNNHLAIGNETYQYEKLIIATGSKPFIPPIPGIEKKRIYPIFKSFEHFKWFRNDLDDANNVVIIGGSFAGIEFASEIAKRGINVTIVDMLPDVAYFGFDEEIRKEIRKGLEALNVRFKFNAKVEEFIGNEFVEGLRIGNEIINADLILLATGQLPNNEIVKDTEIELNELGFIKVDNYQETSVKDIFAIGDVAEKIDFFTGKPTKLMLATIACEEARIAALNLYQKRIKKLPIIPTYSTEVNGISFAATGLTEERCKKLNFDYVVGEISTVDKHPGTLPDTKPIHGKILFSQSGKLLGVELFGSKNVGEIINIASVLIQKEATIDDLINLKFATQPQLTSAPTTYPLVQGAIDAFSKIIK